MFVELILYCEIKKLITLFKLIDSFEMIDNHKNNTIMPCIAKKAHQIDSIWNAFYSSFQRFSVYYFPLRITNLFFYYLVLIKVGWFNQFMKKVKNTWMQSFKFHSDKKKTKNTFTAQRDGCLIKQYVQQKFNAIHI